MDFCYPSSLLSFTVRYRRSFSCITPTYRIHSAWTSLSFHFHFVLIPPPPAAGLARSERGARAPEHPPPDLSWLWVASPPPVTTTVSFITIFFKGTLFLFPFYLAPSYSHAKNRVLVNADREKTKQCASSEPDTLRSMKRLEGFMQDEKDCWSTNRKDFVTPI